MNEQKPPGGIEWTRLPRPDGTFTKGYTWNPIAGCLHGCTWPMPDGTVEVCYAETVAEHGVAKSAYPHGFAVHQFHPERLPEPLRVRTPAGIFLDSMSDLGGRWIPEDQVAQVLAVCRQASHHTFFLLTKNAPRLPRFAIPPNVWVGASSPPGGMWGHALSRTQQEKMLHKIMQVLAQMPVPVRWLSFEPLSCVCEKPGRFIDVVDHRVAYLRGNSSVVRLDGLRDSVKHLLDGPQADGYAQHRGANGLHHAAAVAIGPGQLSNKGTEPWAVAHSMLGGDLGFGPAPTASTPALIQDPVRHLHRDRWQLQHLVRMVWAGQRKCGVATRTLCGPYLLDIGRRQQHLTMATVSWLPAGFVRGNRRRTLPRLLIGRIR